MWFYIVKKRRRENKRFFVVRSVRIKRQECCSREISYVRVDMDTGAWNRRRWEGSGCNRMLYPALSIP